MTLASNTHRRGNLNSLFIPNSSKFLLCTHPISRRFCCSPYTHTVYSVWRISLVGKWHLPISCGTYCFRKKGQTVWIAPEDNDGLGMGIRMPTSEGERVDVVWITLSSPFLQILANCTEWSSTAIPQNDTYFKAIGMLYLSSSTYLITEDLVGIPLPDNATGITHYSRLLIYLGYP